jgi:hypothetical protein
VKSPVKDCVKGFCAGLATYSRAEVESSTAACVQKSKIAYIKPIQPKLITFAAINYEDKNNTPGQSKHHYAGLQ